MAVFSRFFVLALVAASAAAEAIGQHEMPEECDAHDSDACQEALSLRQIRGQLLAPDPKESAALEQRRAPRPLPELTHEQVGYAGRLTSLMQTLTGKTGNSFFVYHQTSMDICSKIMEGGFKPGSRGWCGGAVYFADTMAGTFGEAVGPESHQGCVIRAMVDMGKIKEMPKTCDSHMTGEKLKEMGYDSIRFNDGAGTGWQYVIYDPSRVKSMSVVWVDKAHEMEFNAKFNITENVTVPGTGEASTKDAPAAAPSQ